MYKAEPFPGSKPISVVRCPGCQTLDEPRMGEGFFGGMCVLPCQACGAVIPISAPMLPRHAAAATADKATAAWAASVSALGSGGADSGRATVAPTVGPSPRGNKLQH